MSAINTTERSTNQLMKKTSFLLLFVLLLSSCMQFRMGREQTYTVTQVEEGECQASQHKEGAAVRAKFEFVDQGVYMNFTNEEPVFFQKINDADSDHVYERDYVVMLGTEANERLTLDSDGRGFTIVNMNTFSMLGRRHCITRTYKQE